ncbi:MAG TPA: type II 3-dehydroquinate dehydratase, partial [Acidimicrobiia bacterium]|nr:type II 3-dehydroquinate dehydratase [Acidimicrobiia bacterium]
TLDDLERQVGTWGSDLGVNVIFEQSNNESQIIDLIQGFDGDGMVINPGALTHTSRALSDAIRSVSLPVVEVHISNTRAREPWRADSVVAEACVRTIYGRGVAGYRDALRHLINRAAVPFETLRYGPHEENLGDLRSGGDHVVVLAHGGLWRQEYERDSTESLAIDLFQRGFSTWNIEYRRLGRGGGWPASGHDVLTALDFIPRLGVEPSRISIISHSAGSQLASWAAPRSSEHIDLHVALGPLLDIRSTADAGEVGAAEARALLDRGAPAIAEPDGIPTVLVHGDSDQVVPVECSVAYAAEHGLEHHRTGCDHFSLLDPTRPEWSWVIDRLQTPV